MAKLSFYEAIYLSIYLSIYPSIDFLLRRLILSVLCRGAVSRVVGRVSNPRSGFILAVLGARGTTGLARRL